MTDERGPKIHAPDGRLRENEPEEKLLGVLDTIFSLYREFRMQVHKTVARRIDAIQNKEAVASLLEREGIWAESYWPEIREELRTQLDAIKMDGVLRVSDGRKPGTQFLRITQYGGKALTGGGGDSAAETRVTDSGALSAKIYQTEARRFGGKTRIVMEVTVEGTRDDVERAVSTVHKKFEDEIHAIITQIDDQIRAYKQGVAVDRARRGAALEKEDAERQKKNVVENALGQERMEEARIRKTEELDTLLRPFVGKGVDISIAEDGNSAILVFPLEKPVGNDAGGVRVIRPDLPDDPPITVTLARRPIGFKNQDPWQVNSALHGGQVETGTDPVLLVEKYIQNIQKNAADESREDELS